MDVDTRISCPSCIIGMASEPHPIDMIDSDTKQNEHEGACGLLLCHIQLMICGFHTFF